MKKLFISILIASFILVVVPQIASAQFGKNMVIKGISWKIYESEHFEIFYYFPNKDDWKHEKEYIQDMVRWTETAYKQISQEIGYEMEIKKYGKARIFFYWSRYDASHHPLGPGGAIAYAEPLQLREICVSKEFPDEKIQQIVTHETTHLFQFYLWKLAKGSPTAIFRIWRQLLTFLFEGWSQHTSGLHRTEPNARLVLRYWVLNGGLRYINIKDWVHPALSRSYEICYVIGGYFFDFIKEKYGALAFKNFVTEFRRAKPNAKGFQKVVTQVLKTDFAELDRAFRKYLEDQYKHLPIEKKEALEYGKDILVQRMLFDPEKRPHAVYEPVISPSGDVIAGFTVEKDNLQVMLVSRKDGTVLGELTHGYSLYKYGLWPIIDPYGPGRSLSFSPDGDSILYFAQTAKRYPVLVKLEVVSRKVEKINITLNDPESPEMSKDGKMVIFSAIANGQRDIFSLNLETQKVENLTNDKQFDYAPSFSPDEKDVVYVASIASYNKLFSLNVATKEKSQLTFGPSNEIRPIYSRNGKTIWFVSDQDENETNNIYALDVISRKITQWTDVINGVRTVVPMEDNKLLLGAVGYRDSRHPFTDNLYEVDLSKLEPVAVVNDLLEAQAMEKPDKIQVEIEEIDPEKIRKYKTKFHLDQGMLYGSVDTRYGIYGWGYLNFSDLTATKYIQASVMRFGDYYSNNGLLYFDLSRRWNWGVMAASENHHFYPWYANYWFSPYGKVDLDPVLYNLRLKRTTLNVITQYPLDLCHRLELSLSGTKIQYQYPDWKGAADYYATQIAAVPPADDSVWQDFPEGYRDDYLAYLADEQAKTELRGEFIDKYINDGKFATVNFAIVRDTALYKRMIGPFTNDMYRIDLSLSTGGHNAKLSAEARKYFRLGSEVVFALRGFGGIQWGKTITPWVVGDTGELRGYRWMQFMGNQVVIANAELRLPLVKNFNLFGFYLGDIRAALFADVGRIGFDDKRFNLLNDDDVNSSPIKGSLGIDLEIGYVPFMGLPMHIAFSKRMTEVKLLPKLEDKWQIKIYFGYTF